MQDSSNDKSGVNLPDEIDQDEYLWRGVFDSSRARRETVKFNDFLESKGQPKITVNRFDSAPASEIARIENDAAENRGSSR